MQLNPSDKKRAFAFAVTVYRDGMTPTTVKAETDAYNEEHARRRVLERAHNEGLLVRKLQLV